MARVPAQVVPFVRIFLEQLGLPGDVVADNGQVDASRFLGEVVHEVEVATAVLPPQTIRLRKDGAPVPAPAPGPKPRKKAEAKLTERLGRLIKPTITIRGPFGERVVAPFGTAKPDAWRNFAIGTGVGLGVVMIGITALGFVAGRASARRQLSGLGCPQLPARASGAPLAAA